MDHESREELRKKTRRGKHLIRGMDDPQADGKNVWA